MKTFAQIQCYLYSKLTVRKSLDSLLQGLFTCFRIFFSIFFFFTFIPNTQKHKHTKNIFLRLTGCFYHCSVWLLSVEFNSSSPQRWRVKENGRETTNGAAVFGPPLQMLLLCVVLSSKYWLLDVGWPLTSLWRHFWRLDTCKIVPTSRTIQFYKAGFKPISNIERLKWLFVIFPPHIWTLLCSSPVSTVVWTLLKHLLPFSLFPAERKN